MYRTHQRLLLKALFGLLFLLLTACPSGGSSQLTVAITVPSSDVYTNGNLTIQVVISGGMADEVMLLKNNTPLITLTTPYSYTWDTTKEAEGDYTLLARALKDSQSYDSPARTVHVDRTSPTLTQRTPAPAATNIWVKDPMRVTFSEAVLASTVNSGSVLLKKGSIEQTKTLTLSPDGKTLMVMQTGTFMPPATLSLNLTNTITDLAGNPLAAASWSWYLPDWLQLGTFLDANTNQDAGFPSLALDVSDNPVVAWREDDGTSYNIYVKHWNGSAWQQLGGFLDANTNRDALNPALALDTSDNPVVAWSEVDSTSSNIYVKRWNGLP